MCYQSTQNQFPVFCLIMQLQTIPLAILRIDNCDERRVYKSKYISGPKVGTYTFNTLPKSSDFCLSNDIW